MNELSPQTPDYDRIPMHTKWAQSTRQNLSWGFPTRSCSNRPAQLQRLAQK